jgi:hypothetical protein
MRGERQEAKSGDQKNLFHDDTNGLQAVRFN